MIKAVIFDLDGVVVSTDEFHYLAWKQIADELGIYFDRKINQRLRGVSRAESLEIIFELSIFLYSMDQKQALMDQKNTIYKKHLQRLSGQDILPGVMGFLEELKKQGIKTAIGSSSKNAVFILKQAGLEQWFDVIADGNGIKNSKPDPEVFILAAKLLGVNPEDCIVIEDAYAGIDAAKAAGCKAVAVGFAVSYENADYSVGSLEDVDIDAILK